MAKKKVYAVKKGKVVGIFRDWEACRDSVNGYPGAEYKGFSSEEEAREYLSGTEYHVMIPEESLPEPDVRCTTADATSEKGVIAYVDGSFDEKIGRYAFGCVMLTPDRGIVRKSGNGDNPKSMALRNITGEMLGAMFAAKWCEKNKYPAVEICYDYAGLEKWVTGEWEAKTDLTKKYVEFMREIGARVDITFKKVAAHTGDKYNEEADGLAKAALKNGNGVPKITNI